MENDSRQAGVTGRMKNIFRHKKLLKHYVWTIMAGKQPYPASNQDSRFNRRKAAAKIAVTARISAMIRLASMVVYPHWVFSQGVKDMSLIRR